MARLDTATTAHRFSPIVAPSIRLLSADSLSDLGTRLSTISPRATTSWKTLLPSSTLSSFSLVLGACSQDTALGGASFAVREDTRSLTVCWPVCREAVIFSVTEMWRVRGGAGARGALGEAGLARSALTSLQSWAARRTVRWREGCQAALTLWLTASLTSPSLLVRASWGRDSHTSCSSSPHCWLSRSPDSASLPLAAPPSPSHSLTSASSPTCRPASFTPQLSLVWLTTKASEGGFLSLLLAGVTCSTMGLTRSLTRPPSSSSSGV